MSSNTRRSIKLTWMKNDEAVLLMTRNKLLLLGLLSAVSITGYLIASNQFYGVGFPLDDSWIHQTYARNLANAGEWAFFPGQSSGGSTSPLWAALLTPGHLFGLGPYVWTFTLGWITLWGFSILSTYVFELLVPIRKGRSIWIGILMIFEWHLVWAAISGMETMLFSLFILATFALLMNMQIAPEKKTRKWFSLGILIGSSVWVRPEGILMVGVAGVSVFLIGHSKDHFDKLRNIIALGVGSVLSFGPYLLFNQAVAGDWWPNTFYAKQAEYATFRAAPFLQRYLEQLSLPMVGIGALLIPGFAIYIYEAIRKKYWVSLLPALWVMGYLGLYASRLPVTYQHGRYVIPVMPIYFLLGLAGLASWIQANSPLAWRRMASQVWLLSLGMITAGFWWMGASSYATDVAVIESEMVATALWVAQHTYSDDVIAVHDIGALGYFSGRSLLDLAGLVSPDVVPFIRDENRLKSYLNAKGTTYLITFPGGYPELVHGRIVVFETRGVISPSIGGENMKIYRWGEP